MREWEHGDDNIWPGKKRPGVMIPTRHVECGVLWLSGSRTPG